MALFYFFESPAANLSVFFLVSTIVFYLGPEFFVPSINTRGVPLVQAPAGNIAGVRMTSNNGRTIFAYRSIPYAQPPVGTLRFARPEPIDEPWDGVHEGKKAGYACPQGVPFRWFPKLGSEDCLTLNVYVPKTNAIEEPLPVMVWIHGGGFTVGDASDFSYNPKHLLDRDVVVVTIQYRLGPLGWLNLGSEFVSGNQALWDQRLALLWVQKNIAAFGGNPDRVTIFGESAGSMSVMFQLLAGISDPGEEPLFHAAIAMSGPPYSSFLGLDDRRPIVDLHKAFAAKVGCPNTKNVHKTLQCLQEKSTDDLLQEMFALDDCNFFTRFMSSPSVWRPSADADIAEKPFFKSNPLSALKHGAKLPKIPLMIGLTKDEGLIHTVHILRDDGVQDKLRRDWDKCMVNNIIGKDFSHITDNDHALVKKIEDFYFDGRKGSLDLLDDSFQNLTNLFTDFVFGIGTDMVVRTALEQGNDQVFFYHFDHAGSFSMSDLFGKSLPSVILQLGQKFLGYHTSEKLGVSHADDLLYIFGTSVPITMLPDPEDVEMRNKMVDWWVNFATYHEPTPPGSSHDTLWPRSSMEKDGSKVSSPSYVILRKGQLVNERDDNADQRLSFIRNEIVKDIT